MFWDGSFRWTVSFKSAERGAFVKLKRQTKRLKGKQEDAQSVENPPVHTYTFLLHSLTWDIFNWPIRSLNESMLSHVGRWQILSSLLSCGRGVNFQQDISHAVRQEYSRKSRNSWFYLPHNQMFLSENEGGSLMGFCETNTNKNMCFFYFNFANIFLFRDDLIVSNHILSPTCFLFRKLITARYQTQFSSHIYLELYDSGKASALLTHHKQKQKLHQGIVLQL